MKIIIDFLRVETDGPPPSERAFVWRENGLLERTIQPSADRAVPKASSPNHVDNSYQLD
jgi:hypothetical protein